MSDTTSTELEEILLFVREWSYTSRANKVSIGTLRKAEKKMLAKATQAIEALIAQKVIEGRVDELINTYNHNFIHWGDNLTKAKLDITRRLSELKAELTNNMGGKNGNN